MELVTYRSANGREPFSDWHRTVEPEAKARVTRALARMEQGNLSGTKSVGSGVF